MTTKVEAFIVDNEWGEPVHPLRSIHSQSERNLGALVCVPASAPAGLLGRG